MTTFTRSAGFCILLLLCFGLRGLERLSAKEIAGAGHAGDQTPKSRTASAGAEELLTDDGTADTYSLGDKLLCVNRLTPIIYPTTLRTIRIFFVIPFSPSPVGAQIRLIAFAGAQGTTQPPNNPTLLVNQTVTIPSLPANGGFIDFPVQNGPTINSGDIYVGYQAPEPFGGVTFAGDTAGQPQQRAFLSINNGRTFEGASTLPNGTTRNFMIRAIVANNAAAAPRIEAPPALSFGYVNAGATSEQTLMARNTGDAPVNITSLTSDDPQFTVAPLSLPLTITAGGQAAIKLRFTPTSLGAQNATLTIISDDSARPSLNVALSGVGGQSPTARTLFINSGAEQTGSVLSPGPGLGLGYGLEYAIFVPTGASQLKIDLSGNQDLKLLASFNQPVFSPREGLVVGIEHSSNNPGLAPESISITPSTFPPLRSGPYYIAIVNNGPGAANFNLKATVTGGTAPGAASTVSAASFSGPELASEAIVAGFGSGLATSEQSATSRPLPTTLAGTTIRIRDNAGTERLAPLFYVSPGQANFQIAPGTASGAAFLTFTSGDGKTSTGTAQIVSVAPGIFTANANGQGVPAAVVFRIRVDGSQVFESASRFDSDENRVIPLPIDLGPESDRVFLLLFGTGIRGFNGFVAVTATIGGIPVPVGFAGPAPGFIGLDQLNLGPLPRSLAGRGEVDVVVTVDGKVTNTVKLNVK